MPENAPHIALSPPEIQLLARSLLDRAREGEDATDLKRQLAKLSTEGLRLALPDDSARKAFWINLYNAFNLLLMKTDAGIAKSQIRRMRHFLGRDIVVAGERLSLMRIENDLLRRGQLWWGLGYLRRPFPRSFFREYRLSSADARVHFALNCGAMSCPPIRYYEQDAIEEQLELATRGFMQTEVRWNEQENLVQVSSIFRLYRGDFGGGRGIREWLSRYRNDLPAGKFRLRWLPYDWTTNLDAFA